MEAEILNSVENEKGSESPPVRVRSQKSKGHKRSTKISSRDTSGEESGNERTNMHGKITPSAPHKQKWSSLGNMLSFEKQLPDDLDILQEKPHAESSMGANIAILNVENKSPLVRSRSSFSYKYFVFQNTQSVFNHKECSRMPVTEIDTLMTNTPESIFASAKSTPKKILADDQSVEDSILKDIEKRDFPGIWNHHLVKLYFLMFLIHINQENVFVNIYI